MTSPAAPVTSSGAVAAAVAAQERWVETTAGRLTCLDRPGRQLITAQLKPAASRTAADWATRFARHVFPFALSSGLVFASIIGAGSWATKIPGRQVAAATTAVAYLMIAVAVLPWCRRQTRRVLEQLDRISEKAAHDFLAPYLAIMVVAALLYSIVNASAFVKPTIRHEPPLFYVSEFGALVVVTAIGWLITYVFTVYIYSDALQKSAASHAVSWAELLTTTTVTGWLPAARPVPVPAGNGHIDLALLRLLSCAVSVDGLGQEQYLASSRSVRSVILELELVASDMEQYAVDRVPRSDTMTRRIARQDGTRLASVIRDAKAPLARAIHPRDYTAVAARLAELLRVWADAGPAVPATMINGDTGRAGISRWRRMAGRIWNAALLATAAFVLPLLPVYNSDHTAAAGLRYALVTAAALTILTGGSPAGDTILRNLEGTMPGTKAS